MGFRRDLLFISVWIVCILASLSAGRSRLWHCIVLVSMCGGKGDEQVRGGGKMAVPKMRTYCWLRSLMRWLYIRNRRWFPWVTTRSPVSDCYIYSQTCKYFKKHFFLWQVSVCASAITSPHVFCRFGEDVQPCPSGKPVKGAPGIWFTGPLIRVSLQLVSELGPYCR